VWPCAQRLVARAAINTWVEVLMIQKIISGGVALFIMVLNVFGLWFVPTTQTAFAQEGEAQDLTGPADYEVFLDCVINYLIDRGLYSNISLYVDSDGTLVVNTQGHFTEEQLAGLIAAIHACGMHAMDIEVDGVLLTTGITVAANELTFTLQPEFDTLFPSVPDVNPNPFGDFRQVLINFLAYGSLTAIRIFDFNGLRDLIGLINTAVTLDEAGAATSLQPIPVVSTIPLPTKMIILFIIGLIVTVVIVLRIRKKK